MVKGGDLTLGDEHTIQRTDDVLIGPYTWNLCNVINQCHPDKFNLKICQTNWRRRVSLLYFALLWLQVK